MTDKFYNPLPKRIKYTKLALHGFIAITNLLAALAIFTQTFLWPVAILNIGIAVLQLRLCVWAVRL